ncbi:MAG: ABC transporter permease [Rhodocyclaceae bacterium]|nr:ABC transporter permease [Rhodocyclaceae bacterium]
MTPARIAVEHRADGGRNVVLGGRWTLAAIGAQADSLSFALAEHAAAARTTWNCLDVEALDSAGAMLLWRSWGRALPEVLLTRPEQLRVFERLTAADREKYSSAVPQSPFEWLIRIGFAALGLRRQFVDFVALIGQIGLDVLHLCRVPGDLPRREISANLFKGGVRAMPVTALVGFLIGIVLSYLSALQLKLFGADIFIVNILGMGIVRELGPVLVAILVAGRSGSAMTAQLGVMRVTEEIDALATMGVPRSLRLIFPKVAALALAMPLLVVWTTAIALVGGMVAANLQLDIGYGFFFHALPKAVPVANLWIGLAKGVVFGIFVALVACHFGLRVRPNTESLSANTTASVVTAITVVILLDAVFAIFTREIGLPQ